MANGEVIEKTEVAGTEEVLKEGAPVAQETVKAENPAKMALMKRAAELEKNYSNLTAVANNTVKTINELKDRVLRQEEALNITNSQLIKIENEYEDIQNQLKGMN